MHERFGVAILATWFGEWIGRREFARSGGTADGGGQIGASLRGFDFGLGDARDRAAGWKLRRSKINCARSSML